MMSEQDNTVQKTGGSNQKSQKQERSPRALDSRQAAQRVQSWENPTNLPDLQKAEWYLRRLQKEIQDHG